MPSVLYVSCVGLLMCLFSFSGYEGGAHMAEKQQHRLISGGLDSVWVKPEQDIAIRELVKQ